MGIINQDEFNHYVKEYKKNIKEAVEPDIFIYLKASTENLLNRIQKRGRNYEKAIDKNYLDNLTFFYDKFFLNFEEKFENSKLVFVDTDMVDSDKVFDEICKKLRDL